MRHRIGAAVVTAIMCMAPLAHAQEYPAKTVRIVIPFPPGGGVDRVARLAADRLRDRWGQPFIVDNRAGAAGNIATELVVNAAPDGYTLLYGVPQQFVINKLLYSKLPFDPDTLAPVSVLTTAPNVLVAHPKLGVDTVQQLIAVAKANPGRLNFTA